MAGGFGEADEVPAKSRVGKGEGEGDGVVFFGFAGAASAALCAGFERLGDWGMGRHGEGKETLLTGLTELTGFRRQISAWRAWRMGRKAWGTMALPVQREAASASLAGIP